MLSPFALDLKIEHVQQIVHVEFSKIYNSVSHLVSVSTLFSFLLIDVSPNLIKDVMHQLMLKTVPRLPPAHVKSVQTSTIIDQNAKKNWSREEDEVTLLYMIGIVSAILSASDRAPPLLHTLFLYYELWMPIFYYAPETFAKFIEKLHETYKRVMKNSSGLKTSFNNNTKMLILTSLTSSIHQVSSAIKQVMIKFIATLYDERMNEKAALLMTSAILSDVKQLGMFFFAIFIQKPQIGMFKCVSKSFLP